MATEKPWNGIDPPIVAKVPEAKPHFPLTEAENRMLRLFMRTPEAELVEKLINQEIDHQKNLLISGGAAEAAQAAVYQGKCRMLAEFWQKVKRAGRVETEESGNAV